MLYVRRPVRSHFLALRSAQGVPEDVLLFEVLKGEPTIEASARLLQMVHACTQTRWLDWLLDGPWMRSAGALGASGLRVRHLIQQGITWAHVARTKHPPSWWRDAFHATMEDFRQLSGDVRSTGWTKEAIEDVFGLKLT